MLLTAYDRLRRIKLQADAAFDVQTNREADAVYLGFMRYLKKHILSNDVLDIFEHAQGEDSNTGIKYMNTYPGKKTAASAYLRNKHIISCPAKKFTQAQNAKDLVIYVAFHDNPAFSRNGEYHGFRKESGRKMIVLYYYLPRAHNEEPADEFPLEEFEDHFFKIDKQARGMRSTFTHEYRHLIDDLRARVKNPKGNQARSEDLSDYRGYINSAIEVNARYAEWIHNIVRDLRSGRIQRAGGVAAAFPEFKTFWERYWIAKGYVPKELKAYIDPKNKRRLIRRLSKFWTWAKTASDLADLQAQRFVQKQMRDDDEVYVPREF